MAGVVSMITEHDGPLPYSVVGSSSTERGERVCGEALAFKSYANTGKQASKADHGLDKADLEDGFPGYFNLEFEKLNMSNGVTGAGARGADQQDHGAVDDTEKPSLNSDSVKEGQASSEESKNSSESPNGDAKSDATPPEIMPQKLDTKDADPEEEYSDDDELNFNFMEFSDEEIFNAKAHWKKYVDDPVEKLTRIMEMNEELRRRAAPQVPKSDPLHEFAREYLANSSKELHTSLPKWNNDYIMNFNVIPEMPESVRWMFD